MSHYPDAVLKRGGYKTSRELRDKNVKKKCPFCPKELVFTCYGPHIFRHHADELFLSDNKQSTENRKNLTSKKHLREPLPLDIGEDVEVYGCLGCESIFQKSSTAINHFKNKKLVCSQLHQNNLLSLKEKYPMTQSVPKSGGKMKHKAKLEFFIETLIERVRELEYKHKEEKMDYEERFGEYFEDWELELREEELRKSWTFMLEETSKESTPPKTPPSEPEDDDLLPLVTSKPLTKEEVMLKLLADPSIPEESKQAIQRDYYKNKSQSAPLPLSVAPPPPEEKKKTYEEQLAELDAERKKTPWQRFLQQNPGLSVQEQLQRASIMGIRPDSMGDGFKIVGNTKRPAKTC